MSKEVPGKRHEFIGVIVLAVTVLLALCLVSYDSHDSSFNALFYKVNATNKAGRIGAWVSDILYQLFGFPALLLLVPMVVAGWKLVRGRSIGAPYARALGLLLLIAGSEHRAPVAPGEAEGHQLRPGRHDGCPAVRIAPGQPEPHRDHHRRGRRPGPRGAGGHDPLAPAAVRTGHAGSGECQAGAVGPLPGMASASQARPHSREHQAGRRTGHRADPPARSRCASAAAPAKVEPKIQPAPKPAEPKRRQARACRGQDAPRPQVPASADRPAPVAGRPRGRRGGRTDGARPPARGQSAPSSMCTAASPTYTPGRSSPPSSSSRTPASSTPGSPAWWTTSAWASKPSRSASTGSPARRPWGSKFPTRSAKPSCCARSSSRRRSASTRPSSRSAWGS